jgi:hypothetical protein
MASSQRLHRVQAEDGRVDAMGCIGPFYPRIAIFYVLGIRGIIVFSFLLGVINKALEGWSFLPLLQLSYAISRLGLVYQELIFPIIK